jgi:hypothetical protein
MIKRKEERVSKLVNVPVINADTYKSLPWFDKQYVNKHFYYEDGFWHNSSYAPKKKQQLPRSFAFVPKEPENGQATSDTGSGGSNGNNFIVCLSIRR